MASSSENKSTYTGPLRIELLDLIFVHNEAFPASPHKIEVRGTSSTEDGKIKAFHKKKKNIHCQEDVDKLQYILRETEQDKVNGVLNSASLQNHWLWVYRYAREILSTAVSESGLTREQMDRQTAISIAQERSTQSSTLLPGQSRLPQPTAKSPISSIPEIRTTYPPDHPKHQPAGKRHVDPPSPVAAASGQKVNFTPSTHSEKGKEKDNAAPRASENMSSGARHKLDSDRSRQGSKDAEASRIAKDTQEVVKKNKDEKKRRHKK